MNTKKKLIILSIAFILCVTVGGTLAFSTSVEDIANLFSTSKVQIEQHEYERAKDSSGRYTGELVEFTQRQDIEPAYLVNDVIELSNTSQSWESIGLNSENKLYANSVKNAIDKFVFVENKGTTDAYVRTIIAFECPEGFDYSLIHTNLNESSKINWNKNIGYIKLGEQRYYFIVATYKDALEAGEMSVPSLLQVLLDSKVTNEDMELFGDTFDILVKTQATQKVDDQTSEQVLNKVFGEPNKDNLNKWFDLRKKYYVTNYKELSTAAKEVDNDTVVYVKNDIVDYATSTINISGKQFEINGNDNLIKIGNGSYSINVINDSSIVFNNTHLYGGGFQIGYNSHMEFNGGSMDIIFSSTSGRYGFYVLGDSTLTINDGEFAILSGQNDQRSYIYSFEGATIYINGGTFHKYTGRSGFNEGFRGEGTIIITGGTFGFNLKESWIADGYKSVKNSDGTWTVVPE